MAASTEEMINLIGPVLRMQLGSGGDIIFHAALVRGSIFIRIIRARK